MLNLYKALFPVFVFALMFIQEAKAQYQKTEVTVGQPYPVVDAEHKFYFAQDNEIMTVKIQKRVLTIQKFRSDDLKFQKTKVYDDFDKNFVLEYITEIKGHYYLFYSTWDGENEQLFAREINFTEGTFTGKGVKLFSLNHKVAGILAQSGFYRFTTLDKFQFTMSADSSKLLVQYRLRPDVKRDSKNYDVIGMNVFDFKLKELWRKEFKMPYTEKKMDNIDFTVDREGNAYIIAKVHGKEEDSDKRDEDAPDYSIELLKMSANTQELTIHPMNVPNKYLRTLRIYETAKGDLVGAGFYNKDKKTNSADGVFTFNVSKDMKVSNAATHEIPLSILNQNVSNKQERKNERKEEGGKAEFQNMQLTDIQIEPDGSTLLIGEQYYVVVHHRHTPNGGTMVSYTYHYNDILVTKIQPDGSLGWMKKIPKRQVGGKGRGGMSFRYFVDKDDYYFVFLDNEKNLDLAKDELPAKHADGQGGFLALHIINDKTGDVSRSMILDTRNVKGMEIYQFSPSRIVGTDRMEFVFEAYKKKKEDILIKVRL